MTNARKRIEDLKEQPARWSELKKLQKKARQRNRRAMARLRKKRAL